MCSELLSSVIVDPLAEELQSGSLSSLSIVHYSVVFGQPMDGSRDTLLNEKFLLVRYYKMANCYLMIIHIGPGHDKTEMLTSLGL